MIGEYIIFTGRVKAESIAVAKSMLDARTRYESLQGEIATEICDCQTVETRLIAVRTVLFLLAVVFFTLAYFPGEHRIASLAWLGAISLLAFAIAASFHESNQRKKNVLETRKRLYFRLIARLNRDWDSLRSSATEEVVLAGEGSALSNDLDIFGDRSLFAWLSLASTRMGRSLLAQWLLNWGSIETIQQRQSAAKELAPHAELREELLWRASSMGAARANPEVFTDWATGPNWCQSHRITQSLSWGGPVAVLVGMLSVTIGILSETSVFQTVGVGILALGCIVNLMLTIGMLGPIHDVFARISSGHYEVFQYTSLFKCVHKLPHESPLLQDIKQGCFSGDRNVLDGLRQLGRLVRLANLQRNILTYIPYLILQLILLWDFRVMEWLTHWQSKFGSQCPGWLARLGQVEALLSVSAIYYENPSWATPQWTSKDCRPLVAIQLGHPLLSEQQCVGNDVEIGSSHPLFLVTGSNMAGKSTFLRALGLNLLLSRTGSSVCAASFIAWPMDLVTSIRVRDSLHDGVSFFMAELHRLREIVDHVKLYRDDEARRPLVLLDEVLQGTNSRERLIAVIRIIEQLLACNAIVAATTHDLDLANDPTISARAKIVHFREYFEQINGQEVMRFDYRIRPGVAPTTNALKLLEIVGL